MHRNHSSEAHTHRLFSEFSNPLGTSPQKIKSEQNFQDKHSVPVSYSMQPLRSSQPRALHHHASEHLSSFTIISSQLTPLTRSDNPSQKNTDQSFSLHSHGKPKTDARIQTHQNLFTLTKNKLLLNIEAGRAISGFFPRDLFRNKQNRKPKLDFPQNNLTRATHLKWWRWTESNRRPPACKAGALPIELHPQSFVSDHRQPALGPRPKVPQLPAKPIRTTPTNGGPGRT